MTAASRAACGRSARRPGAHHRAAVCLAAWLALIPLVGASAKDVGLSLVAVEQGAVSRITLDAPKTVAPRIEANGDSLVLRLPKGVAYDLSALGGRAPRRIAAITALPDGLRILAEPGARMRHHRIGERIIVEVGDAPGGRAAAAELQPGTVVTAGAVRPGTPDLRLAALAGGIASDASPMAVATARPVPMQLAQAIPQLPPMPAAARPSFGPAAARQGPFGAADPQGRPGLTAQAPGLPQLVQPPLAPGVTPTAQRMPQQPVSVMLEAGAGRLLTLPAPAFTIMAADPRVARVQPASPTSIFIMGITGGRTNIIATAEDGTLVVEYDVMVNAARAAAPALPVTNAGPPAASLNAANIESMIRRLVRGGAGVRVANLGDQGLALTGLVPSAAEAQRAEAIAKAYAGEARPVINSLTLLSSVQVNLRVRVAEMSRSVTRELGFNWRVLFDNQTWLVGLRTAAAPALGGGLANIAGDRFLFGYRGRNFDINSVVDALAGDQLISILAEPNLMAQSGEVASFLAGGEFPVPVSASALTGAIGIEFKQFGVSLGFVPTVLSPERLNLRVRPEVSELSDNGAISLPLGNGVVRIPALSVRRAETTIEVGSGQSFAIAGLLQRNTAIAASSLIGLGDIPVLGALFRSDRFRRAETELVIIVTPYLVRPVSDPNVLAAPTDGFRPATDLERLVHRRQIARGATPTPVRLPADAGFIVE